MFIYYFLHTCERRNVCVYIYVGLIASNIFKKMEDIDEMAHFDLENDVINILELINFDKCNSSEP